MAAFFQTIPGALILLVVGFVGLIKGADFFVEGASNVAKRFKVPSLIIGLTIVAMGTSLPETAVSISASIAGSNSLAISNVSGSNLFNLLVVVGLCCIMQKVEVDKDTIRRDIPYSLLAAVLLIVLGMMGGMELGRFDGIILLAFFAFFLFLMIKSALKAAAEAEDDEEVSQSLLMSIVSIVGGAAAIAIGGEDPVAPAKVLKEYAEKIESFQILAGYLDGAVVDAETVNKLADIPSKEVLLAKLLGSIKSPLYNFAYALQAIIDKDGEAAPEAAPEAAAEEAAAEA